jgi:dienelactone hydrolase
MAAVHNPAHLSAWSALHLTTFRGTQPAVIVAHTAAGPHEPFITDMLQMLASHGYAAFALDLYGAEHQTSREENKACTAQLKAQRHLIAERALAALQLVQGLPGVDTRRVAALGFCLGGMCVMDLLRVAPPDALRLVVSFHGILDRNDANERAGKPTARVVAFHGYQDAMIGNAKLLEFCDEMEGRGVDYEVRVLGHKVLHAFMRPDKTSAEDEADGFQYNAVVADRAWRDTRTLLHDMCITSEGAA